MKRLQNIPVAILPTMVGACTLGNVFLSMGYSWVANITLLFACLILVLYIAKVGLYYDTFRKEYKAVVPGSLHAGFTMILMILGSALFPYHQGLGKGLWLVGLSLHVLHIIIFTYRNVIREFHRESFVPSWFVTYNGVMVSTVVGGVMKEPLISTIIVYYGIFIFTLIIPFMVYRLWKFPIKDAVYHTKAIVLAPSSLCLVSYLNVVKEPNAIVVYYLYAAVAIAVLYIIMKLPSYFAFTFTPGYAGLTFPMAIGCVATVKFAGFLKMQGMEEMSAIFKQVSGIQIYITTGIIAYVLLQFIRMLKDSLCKA